VESWYNWFPNSQNIAKFGVFYELKNAVFGKEHKELKFSQFYFGEYSSGSCVVDTENGSKN